MAALTATRQAKNKFLAGRVEPLIGAAGSLMVCNYRLTFSAVIYITPFLDFLTQLKLAANINIHRYIFVNKMLMSVVCTIVVSTCRILIRTVARVCTYIWWRKSLSLIEILSSRRTSMQNARRWLGITYVCMDEAGTFRSCLWSCAPKCAAKSMRILYVTLISFLKCIIHSKRCWT